MSRFGSFAAAIICLLVVLTGQSSGFHQWRPILYPNFQGNYQRFTASENVAYTCADTLYASEKQPLDPQYMNLQQYSDYTCTRIIVTTKEIISLFL